MVRKQMKGGGRDMVAKRIGVRSERVYWARRKKLSQESSVKRGSRKRRDAKAQVARGMGNLRRKRETEEQALLGRQRAKRGTDCK